MEKDERGTGVNQALRVLRITTIGLLCAPFFGMAQTVHPEIQIDRLEIESSVGDLKNKEVRELAINQSVDLIKKTAELDYLHDRVKELQTDLFHTERNLFDSERKLSDSFEAVEALQRELLNAERFAEMVSGQLTQAAAERDSLQMLWDSADTLTSLDRPDGFDLILKYRSFDPGVEWEGHMTFLEFAEGDWADEWNLNYYWGFPKDAETAYHEKLIEGEVYAVRVTVGEDAAGYVKFHLSSARPATEEEIEQATWY